MPISLRTRLLLLIPALLLALGSGLNSYRGHLVELRQGIEDTFAARYDLTHSYLALINGQVGAMQRVMQEHLSNPASETPLELPVQPDDGYWTLDQLDGRTLAGRFSGLGGLPPDPQLAVEMRAASVLDTLITPVQQYNPQISWMYYTSIHRFMYLAPSVPPGTYRFKLPYYQKPSWSEVTPQANPRRRQIISSLFQDAAGKGPMISVSAPVYRAEQFLGAVSLDLSIDLLRQLIGIGQAVGESLLVDEHGELVASHRDFTANPRYPLPAAEQPAATWYAQDGQRWLGRPLAGGQLWLLHQVDQQLYWTAARKSSMTWLLIALLLAVYSLAWRLFFGLRRVTRLMQTDPLTGTLNRRGFYDKASHYRALARRQNMTLAVLLMDIDHFKRINDRHGHPVGDRVLEQIGRYMLGAARSFDLICRWGGEEFAVLLLLDDPESLAQIAERMRQQAQRAHFANDEVATLSGGLVFWRDNETLDSAVRRADQLLYQAKSQGRDRIVSDLTLKTPDAA